MQALQLIQKSSELEYAPAKSSLGSMYYNGLGVRQDYIKARQLYEKAVEQGDALAQYNLGSMYYNGLGVRQNKAIAKDLFGRACDNGFQNGCRSEERRGGKECGG